VVIYVHGKKATLIITLAQTPILASARLVVGATYWDDEVTDFLPNSVPYQITSGNGANNVVMEIIAQVLISAFLPDRLRD